MVKINNPLKEIPDYFSIMFLLAYSIIGISLS